MIIKDLICLSTLALVGSIASSVAFGADGGLPPLSWGDDSGSGGLPPLSFDGGAGSLPPLAVAPAPSSSEVAPLHLGGLPPLAVDWGAVDPLGVPPLMADSGSSSLPPMSHGNVAPLMVGPSSTGVAPLSLGIPPLTVDMGSGVIDDPLSMTPGLVPGGPSAELEAARAEIASLRAQVARLSASGTPSASGASS